MCDKHSAGRLPASILTRGLHIAFFTTLRANINLELDSTPTSLTNTPDCLRPINVASSTGSLAPLLPSLLLNEVSQSEETDILASASRPLADIAPLTTRPAASVDDTVEALHLIADSVAQQRQLAFQAITLHPGILALLLLALGLVYQNCYRGARSDLAIGGTTSAGVIIAFLLSARYLSRGYIEEAESVGTWKWLDKGRDDASAVGDEDEVLLSRFGDEVIGALILRGVREQCAYPGSGNNSPRKRRQNSGGKNAAVTGKIRGWAVQYRYRRKGVGAELLEEAVKICQERGWQGPEFADDHANSARLLPNTFNRGFNETERRAKEMLDKVKREAGIETDTGSSRKGKR